jgi:hypothetical protein
MAIAVVQSAWTTGGGNNAVGTLGLGATAGNLLVAFAAQSASVSAPTCATGFTVNATSALFNASAASVWVAYTIAAGGETTATWTPAAGGTINGVTIWELSGAANPIALDFTPPVHTDNITAAVSGNLAVTTTVPGSIVLIGLGRNSSFGTVGSWTGTNVATNAGSGTARCFGGSFITTVTVSSTFTANWATSGIAGMLGIALQPLTIVAGAPAPTHLPFMR